MEITSCFNKTKRNQVYFYKNLNAVTRTYVKERQKPLEMYQNYKFRFVLIAIICDNKLKVTVK